MFICYLVQAKVSQADKSKKVDLSYKLSDLQFFQLKILKYFAICIYLYVSLQQKPPQKKRGNGTTDTF